MTMLTASLTVGAIAAVWGAWLLKDVISERRQLRDIEGQRVIDGMALLKRPVDNEAHPVPVAELESGLVIEGEIVPVVTVAPAVEPDSVALDGGPESDLWQSQRDGYALTLAYWSRRICVTTGTAEGRHHHEKERTADPSRATGQHRAIGDRPARIAALIEATSAFEAIAAGAGHPVTEHGPREADIKVTRAAWVKGQWQQLDLLEASRG